MSIRRSQKNAAFEAAGPPVGAGRCLVTDHGVRHQPQVRHAIGPGQELGHVAHRRGAVRPHVGADVDEDVAANAADGAVALERDLDLALRLARMRDGHEMLAAVLDPFDRTAEPARRERDQEVLRIEFAARAKSAADIVFDVIDAVSGSASMAARVRRLKNGSLAAPDMVSRCAVPFGDEPARLHGERGQPLHSERSPAVCTARRGTPPRRRRSAP